MTGTSVGSYYHQRTFTKSSDASKAASSSSEELKMWFGVIDHNSSTKTQKNKML